MPITSKGLVTIPRKIRERTGLLPHTEVDILIDQGQVVIRPVTQNTPAARIDCTRAPMTRSIATPPEEDAPTRVVGHRRIPPITFVASGQALLAGARFNDALQALPTGGQTGVRKGLYRFKTHSAANQHQDTCVLACMVQQTRERLGRG